MPASLYSFYNRCSSFSYLLLQMACPADTGIRVAAYPSQEEAVNIPICPARYNFIKTIGIAIGIASAISSGGPGIASNYTGIIIGLVLEVRVVT